MSRVEAEAALEAAGAAEDDAFPLLDAAVACSLHDDPRQDPAPAALFLAAAAERLRHRLQLRPPEAALAETLCGELGFDGDLITWKAAENTDVLRVLARRRGVSAALGLLYIAVGRACGLEIRGVDFPGHFLLRLETDEGPLALDPFSGGRVAPPSELTRRALRVGLTPMVADRLEMLMAPVSDRAVLMRLQNTIFARATVAGDHLAAERSALRRALLAPRDHRPWIDVAAARERQGALAGALEALSRAQALDGGAALTARAQRERVRLQLN